MNKVGSESTKNKQLKVGMLVKHNRFGQGKILEIDGLTDNKKAIILINKSGQKTLLLKFAKLEIIE